MPVRGPFLPLLRWIGAFGAGGLAVIGALALRGPGLVAVGVAGMLVACTVVGLVRDAPADDRRSLVGSAVQASCWTVGVLVMLAGVAALAGGLVAVLAGAMALGAWLLVRVARSRNRPGWAGRPSRAAPKPTGVEVLPRSLPTRSDVLNHSSGPVSVLPTSALGREWLRTSAALRARLRPADRAALVRRREETLDELERRDPGGFARWLAGGPTPDSDPADYVRGRPVQDDPTAGTDAA